MNEDNIAVRHIEPDSLVGTETVAEGGNIRRTAVGFNAQP
jgi:hypothetical protein